MFNIPISKVPIPSSIFLMSYLRLSNLRRKRSFFRFSCNQCKIFLFGNEPYTPHHCETSEYFLGK
jgi:hypothetical protein